MAAFRHVCDCQQPHTLQNPRCMRHPWLEIAYPIRGHIPRRELAGGQPSWTEEVRRIGTAAAGRLRRDGRAEGPDRRPGLVSGGPCPRMACPTLSGVGQACESGRVEKEIAATERHCHQRMTGLKREWLVPKLDQKLSIPKTNCSPQASLGVRQQSCRLGMTHDARERRPRRAQRRDEGSS
jgi:hypothetical protein